MNEALKYALPILMVSLVSSALVLWGWLKKNTPMGRSYSVMMLVLTLWLIFFAFGLLSSQETYRIVAKLEYLTILALPFTWLVFSVSFSDLKKRFSSAHYALLLLVPLILLFVAFFNEQSGLLFNHHKTFGLSPPILMSDHSTSGWFYLHVVYSVAYFVIGTWIFLKSLRQNPTFDRKQILVLVLGVLIPWIGNITFIFRLIPIPRLDLAPFVFVISGSLIAWGLFYSQFVNIVNLAHTVLIDRMGDGLIVLDKNNWVLEINLAALTLFRINKAAVIGHPVHSFLKPYPDLMDKAGQISGKNMEVTLKIGQKERFFAIDILPLYAGQGLFAGKILLLKDITLLKETANRLEIAKTRAEKADSLKSAFLANLSHEIKTPMNAIMGFSDLLNDQSVSEEERHEFIDHIRNSGSTLLHLIDDIIDISKLDAGQISLVNRAVDLSKMMAEMFAMVNDSLLAEGKNQIDLILDTENLNDDLIISGDPERIRQVITNLLDNAVKFTKKGSIQFGYYLDKEKEVQFFVKDTGVGIPFDKHPIIFERFGRVYTSNQQEYSGTGLGLALTKGLVKMMGGRIWFDSVYGKGTNFYFSLPYLPAEDRPLETRPLDKTVGKKYTGVTDEPVAPPPMQEPAESSVVTPPEIQSDAVPEDAEKEASIRDHISDIPEEADLIFEPGQTPKSTIQDETDFSGTKLLVIDYDDMSYLFVEMVLRPTNIQIIRAKTLQQGMNLLRGGTDLTGILLSSEIPDEELIPAIRIIKDKFPRQRIIAITPFASAQKRKECLSAGSMNVVPKPIKQRELLAAVRNLHVMNKM